MADEVTTDRMSMLRRSAGSRRFTAESFLLMDGYYESRLVEPFESGPGTNLFPGFRTFRPRIRYNSDNLKPPTPSIPLNSDKQPELVLADENDPAAARRIRRLASDGSLRRLHAGVYTSNSGRQDSW